MEEIYTGEDAPTTLTKSIFLAGPSLRPGQEKEIESWRKDAIQILNDIGFDGVVFIPEFRDNKFNGDSFDYDGQVEWEEKYLNMADCIVFWVPRDLSQDKKGNMKLPAFTTNIEFGRWESSGKIVFGAPEDAEKNTYLKYYAEKYNVPVADTLTETLQNALDKVGNGAERSDAERFVPLMIWNTDSFKSWYNAQKEAGNRLDDARLLYSFRPRYKDFVFLWILQVSVYIESEKRNKINEFVLSRPDISSICLYYDDPKNESIFDAEVVLVKEFRSPASTEDGFIHELIGGSSAKPGEDPIDVAADEVIEETGFNLEPGRLQEHGARQLAGTLSSHKSHLFSAKITKEELEWFKSQKDIAHGNIKDTERTFIEVYNVSDILKNKNIDWSTVGMILSIISS